MRLKIWVEVLTTEQMTEVVDEVPDERWNAMTPAEREEFKALLFTNLQAEVANGGCEEVDE